MKQRYSIKDLKHNIHVYWTDISASATAPANLDSILSEDELKKASGILSEGAKNRFLQARILRRRVISSYGGGRPSEVVFDYGINGKPKIKTSSSKSDISFNVSHSHNLIVCAVTCKRDLGVDVEHIKPRKNLIQIAERFFSEDEAADLKLIKPDAVTDVFFKIWTRKEAYLKAKGKGLAGIEDAKKLVFSSKSAEFYDSLRQWFYREIDLPLKGYSGCVVASGKACPVRVIKTSNE